MNFDQKVPKLNSRPIYCSRLYGIKHQEFKTYKVLMHQNNKTLILRYLLSTGNGCVVIVLVASRSKMDVPRFLVCNLAMADFCMGLYLGFLAVVDAATLGDFRRFAIDWQFSAGCQVNIIRKIQIRNPKSKIRNPRYESYQTESFSSFNQSKHISEVEIPELCCNWLKFERSF